MKIVVNGQSYPAADKTTLDRLLQELDLQGKRIAVEINRRIIPRSSYMEYELKSGDKIEIIGAIGGG